MNEAETRAAHDGLGAAGDAGESGGVRGLFDRNFVAWERGPHAAFWSSAANTPVHHLRPSGRSRGRGKVVAGVAFSVAGR
jgi:hypothetical protein